MMVRSRSLLLLIAALASTVVAAEAADWKRGLDAIVTKLQTKDDATAPVEDANTIVPENPDPEVADESPSKLAAIEVSTMLLQGNSTDACKKLADELCTEVEQSVETSRLGIQALPDGSKCKFEGQEEVEQNKQDVVRTETESKEAADRAEEAARATVDFGSFTLSSLDESMCVQFWKDEAYIAAKGNAEEAKEASREAKIAWNSATERLQESILRAANKERECLCNVQRNYNNTYSTATKNSDEEAKAYAKCNHMKCYLENTPADKCEYVVPTVSPRKFQDVPNSCDQILNTQKNKASQINAPTNDDKEREFRDCNAISTGDQSGKVFFWHYGAVQPVFEYSPKSSHGWKPFGSSSVESFPNWWHSSPWDAGNPSYDIAAYVNGIKVKTYNEPTTKPALPTSAAEVDNLCVIIME